MDRPSSIKIRPWKVETARSRRIVQSSDSEVSDSQPHIPRQDEVLVLSDSSPGRPPNTPKSRNLKTARPASGFIALNPVAPLYADEEPWNIDDGSILTL